jgi:membrane protein DedA with SNARE-associated domain
VIVFFGRLVPIIRTLISIPAGLARMPALLFFGASALGALLWNIILVGAGYLLNEHYELVETILDPVTILVLAGVVILYLYRLITWRPSRAR